MSRWIILASIILAVLIISGLIATRGGAASPARAAPPTVVPPPASYAGVPNARFAYTAVVPVTSSAPLLPAPPPPVQVPPETLRALGITLPVPRAQPRTDDQILADVRAQLDTLPAPPAPSAVHLRPADRGELHRLDMVGRDDGTQVLVLVACPNCDAKPLIPSAHGALAVDWLLFICERNYDGCRVLGSAGPGSERVRQAQTRARLVPLPASAPRGTPAPLIPPPFAQ